MPGRAFRFILRRRPSLPHFQGKRNSRSAKIQCTDRFSARPCTVRNFPDEIITVPREALIRRPAFLSDSSVQYFAVNKSLHDLVSRPAQAQPSGLFLLFGFLRVRREGAPFVMAGILSFRGLRRQAARRDGIGIVMAGVRAFRGIRLQAAVPLIRQRGGRRPPVLRRRGSGADRPRGRRSRLPRPPDGTQCRCGPQR